MIANFLPYVPLFCTPRSEICFQHGTLSHPLRGCATSLNWGSYSTGHYRQFAPLCTLFYVHRGRKLTSSTGTIQAHCLFIFLFKILCAPCDGARCICIMSISSAGCGNVDRQGKKQPVFLSGMLTGRERNSPLFRAGCRLLVAEVTDPACL